MAAVEELPDELMALILSKLPAKSLLRFKCVQKSWYTLIKSPYFIQLHRSSSYSTSSKNHDCFIVRRFHIERQQQNALSFYSYETLDILGHEINVPISSRCLLTLCGSCDGLVCLTNRKDQILICNPTIREFRSLFVPPSLDDGSGYHIDSIALGSDPKTGQYKLVMVGMPYRYDLLDEYYNSDCEIHLYDFGTDTWRETGIVFPGLFRYSRHAVSFNGVFHWSPCDRGSILLFHMSNEVTGSIPLPDFVNFSHRTKLCVSSKSQLSLIFYDCKGRFEICVMAEYGVKESWTRLFKIGPLPNIHVPMAFWDEQRLFLDTKEGQLASWDLQNQNLCYFPIDGDFDLYPYSQSLVSVNGIGHPNYFE